ncbi:hypothetical protein [Aeromicrobium sp. UC242_57]|uniref:hypothetical protein n=1 Tax=Aeromicrobium sp. UC242_57 TaxID=3374624 RepID=UPI0037AA8E0D
MTSVSTSIPASERPRLQAFETQSQLGTSHLVLVDRVGQAVDSLLSSRRRPRTLRSASSLPEREASIVARNVDAAGDRPVEPGQHLVAGQDHRPGRLGLAQLAGATLGRP